MALVCSYHWKIHFVTSQFDEDVQKMPLNLSLTLFLLPPSPHPHFSALPALACLHLSGGQTLYKKMLMAAEQSLKVMVSENKSSLLLPLSPRINQSRNHPCWIRCPPTPQGKLLCSWRQSILLANLSYLSTLTWG